MQAPQGADRFYSLISNDFYDGARFFRYADNFVVQWGLKGAPNVDKMYMNGANIQDDPFKKSNTKGRVTFATSGTNTRSTQAFVNLADNTFLDSQGFTPFGELASEEDLELFKKKISAQYGEKADQVSRSFYIPTSLYPSLSLSPSLPPYLQLTPLHPCKPPLLPCSYMCIHLIKKQSIQQTGILKTVYMQD